MSVIKLANYLFQHHSTTMTTNESCETSDNRDEEEQKRDNRNDELHAITTT